jgi:hypothetical protein
LDPTKQAMAGDQSPTRMKIRESLKVVERSVGKDIDVSSSTKLTGFACRNPRMVRRPE